MVNDAACSAVNFLPVCARTSWMKAARVAHASEWLFASAAAWICLALLAKLLPGPTPATDASSAACCSPKLAYVIAISGVSDRSANRTNVPRLEPPPPPPAPPPFALGSPPLPPPYRPPAPPPPTLPPVQTQHP